MERKIVFVRRRKPRSRIPHELLEDSKWVIGSALNHTGGIRKGLSPDEKKTLLPALVEAEYGSTDFYMRVEEWYAGHTVRVPYHNPKEDATGKGIKLNITVDENGIAEDPLDYVNYHFCRVNPFVWDPEEKNAKGEYMPAKISHMYEIVYPSKDKEKESKSLGDRKEAYKEFIKLTPNAKRFNMVYEILFPNFQEPEGFNMEDKEGKVEKDLMENPTRFLGVVNDKHLETRSFIYECLSKEVIRRAGNTLLDGDKIIGNTFEEAILFLEDKKNSEDLMTLRSRLKAYSK